MNCIEVKNLVKKYKSIIAVNNISFSIKKGDVLGIIGPNGAGKTTTLKTILGLILPDSGEVFINSENIKKTGKKYLNKISGLLEGTRNFYMYLTPIENMEYFWRIRGLNYNKLVKNNFIKILNDLGLSEVINKNIEELSRGMQQKVSIACSLMVDPDILLLDEPTLGLDVETSNNFKNWLREMASKNNKTIIITSHNLSFIESLCNNILIINKGEIVWDGRIEDLKKKYYNDIYSVNIENIINPEQLVEMNKICKTHIKINDNSTDITFFTSCSNDFFDHMILLKKYNSTIINMNKNNDDLEKIFMSLLKE